jgi:glycosyltransferase involved in cell wall biosynthesis
LKICLSVNSSPWSRFKGGGQIAVHFLASTLSDLGHEVHVIYSKQPGEKVHASANYHIHWVRHFNVATINLNVFSFGLKAWRLDRKYKFDVFHGNAEEAYFFRWVCSKSTTQVFTSHAPFIPKTGILKALLSPIFFLKNVNSYLLRQAAANADRLITFSEFSRKLIVNGLGGSSLGRVQVVSPGIDPSWFNVVRNSENWEEIIFWGRLEDEKGIPELLTAMDLVQKRRGLTCLNLIGEGNQEIVYRNRVKELGLNVNFFKWKSPEEIQELVSRSALGVFPSRIESFGLAVAEAQAANLPIVCTEAGALPEIVENGVTGRVVPPQSPEDLAKAIIYTLENKKESDEMAQLGRERANKRFSWKIAAKNTAEIYKKAI